MQLVPIDRRNNLSRNEFKNEYLDKNIPVVLVDLAAEWPAIHKWTWDFLRDGYGNLTIPVFTNDYHEPGKNYMEAKKFMSFGEYLTLIQTKPTDYRMFLYNIFQHAPELMSDFSIPEIMDGFMDKFPFMFFGGQGSTVSLHYDIDCSCVFHTHFQTEKRCILFAPDQSRLLYKLPFTVHSYADILQPDYNAFPALQHVKGYEITLQHGETLFMPARYWHFMHYLKGGYSLSLRANPSPLMKVKGAMNIARHYLVDKGMNRVMGRRWKEYKINLSKSRALKSLESLPS